MAFENKTIHIKDFEYCITLCGLLKEEHQVKNLNGEICFLIKTNDILKFYRKFDVYIKMTLVLYMRTMSRVVQMLHMVTCLI